ncbi:MAG TPA: N-acetylmuramoyl-L-alanine amidase [Polyangiaceae bacterium]|nr:N-acetylmuramoyl-L-alanine amidase [Polyangiaceae bacterium]
MRRNLDTLPAWSPAAFVRWAMLAMCVACDSGSAPSPAPGAPLVAAPTTVPTSRAELVAAADHFAVRAAGLNDGSAVALLAHAAELRDEGYRLEGRQVDALEALELWGDASERGQPGDCALGLGLARARHQVTAEPARLYRDLYVLRQQATEVGCQERLDRALQVLSAFSPSPAELAGLRQLARGDRPAEAKGEAASGSGATPSDDRSQIVLPEVLEKGLTEPTRITQVEPFSAERTARVVVHVTHPTKFHIGQLEGGTGRGPRLFVDIDRATYKGPASFETTGLVEAVRLGQQKDGERVVLDLSQKVHHRVFYLPDPFRLVVDLSVDPPDAPKRARDLRRVVLDPGHGGNDPGAIAANGLCEKDVTLDIAHRAAPLLAREVGVSTLLTRDVDAYVPLDERAARANAFHADLFVSIHLNSSENASVRGVMTFVLDTSKDATAAQIAARENSSTAAAAAELANSLSRIESLDRRASSQLFADMLQRAAGASLRQAYSDVEDHGVRSAGFYVLAGAAMPAVLFEGSFLSHPVEAARLNTEAYRQRLADAIVNAVRAYRDGL